MLPPLLVVEGHKLNPFLKVLILPLNDSLLPFLIVSNVIVTIEPIVLMVSADFITLRYIVCLKLS
jgi:hypothetical protein